MTKLQSRRPETRTRVAELHGRCPEVRTRVSKLRNQCTETRARVATNLAHSKPLVFSRRMHDSSFGFDAPRHTAPHPSAPYPSAGERRHERRGNALSDLCRILELTRREAGFSTLALADEDGLVIAGAGRYSDCEVLGALATSAAKDAEGSGPVVITQFELLGSWVSLCAPSADLSPELTERTRAACSRVLGRRIKSLCH